MINLAELQDTHRIRTKVQRVGRGPGSGRGKTSCRGQKGDKSRSGYKRNFGKEGGQMPLFRKMPIRGFSNSRFKKECTIINFSQIDEFYSDGEVVNCETLYEKGYTQKSSPKTLKILASGELKKKVTIEAHLFSKEAESKLQSIGISVKKLS